MTSVRLVRRWIGIATCFVCLATITTTSLYVQQQQQQLQATTSFPGTPPFDNRIPAGSVAGSGAASTVFTTPTTRTRTSTAAAAATASDVVTIPVDKDDLIYSNKRLAPVVVEKFKLIFFDVPKVASSAFMILFQRMSGIDRDKLKYPNLVRHAKYSKLTFLFHYTVEEATRIMNDPSWTRATFVREPAERVLSAYLDKGVASNFTWVRQMCCGTGPTSPAHQHTTPCVHNIVPLEDGRRRIKKHSITKQECLPPGRQSFSDFIDFVPKCRNDHWYPQSERMDTKHWQLVNFVGSMDNLQEDAKKLLERVGAWEKFGRTGWGKDGMSPIFGSDATNIVRNHSHGASDQMKTYYSSPELYQRVAQYYRSDYQHPTLNLTLLPPPSTIA